MGKKTAAIIVILYSCSSYDPHFTNTAQKSEEDTKTLVYKTDAAAVDILIQGFEVKSTHRTVLHLFKKISQLNPDCTGNAVKAIVKMYFPKARAKFLSLLTI
jgi:hypothetical protein